MKAENIIFFGHFFWAKPYLNIENFFNFKDKSFAQFFFGMVDGKGFILMKRNENFLIL